MISTGPLSVITLSPMFYFSSTRRRPKLPYLAEGAYRPRKELRAPLTQIGH